MLCTFACVQPYNVRDVGERLVWTDNCPYSLGSSIQSPVWDVLKFTTHRTGRTPEQYMCSILLGNSSCIEMTPYVRPKECSPIRESSSRSIACRLSLVPTSNSYSAIPSTTTPTQSHRMNDAWRLTSPVSEPSSQHTPLNILRQPPYRLTVPLPHDNRAHEQLHRPDPLQRHLALACGLIHAQLVTQLILGDGIGVVDLVAQDDEGHLGELLHGEECVEFGLGLGEALVVLGVNEEDDAVDLGCVVAPDAAGCDVSGLVSVCNQGLWRRTLLVTTEVEGGETDVANGKFLGG